MFNPLLLTDCDSIAQAAQSDKSIAQRSAYLIPREGISYAENKSVMFGLQGYIVQYLVRGFYFDFFARPKTEVLEEYRSVMNATCGEGHYDLKAVEALYDLGYLPVEVRALPEGCCVNTSVPMVEVSNTHPKFAWLVPELIASMRMTLWPMLAAANVGCALRKCVNAHYKRSADDAALAREAIEDCSMRDMAGMEYASGVSAAFCLSFGKTKTIPAVLYLEEYYKCSCDRDKIADGRERFAEVIPCNSDSKDSEKELAGMKDRILQDGKVFGMESVSPFPEHALPELAGQLWNVFGGTKNGKGFRVLDPHVKLRYGSVQPSVESYGRIYGALEDAGFAADNVVFATDGQILTGSLNGRRDFTPYKPGIDVVDGGFEDRVGRTLMKGTGCMAVHFDGRDFECVNGLSFAEHDRDPMNVMIPVFRNSVVLKRYSLDDVRRILWGGKF